MTTPQNTTDLLGPFTGSDASTCGTISAKAMTAEQLLELMKEARHIQAVESPDVFLMTYRTEEAVKRKIRKEADVCDVPRREMPFCLFGIRYESYPTMEEVSLRAIELTMKGRVVSVLEDAA